MKNTQARIIAVALAAVISTALPGHAQQIEELVNGGFEQEFSPPDQVPNWQFTSGDSPLFNSSLYKNTDPQYLSPYTALYGASTVSVHLKDGTTNTGPLLFQTFNPQRVVTLEYDFLPTGALGQDSPWVVELLGSNNSPAFHMDVDAATTGAGTSWFTLDDGSGVLPIMPLASDRYWHVEAIVDTLDGIYSGTIDSTMGDHASWSSRFLLGGNANEAEVIVRDNSAATANGDLYLDNFAVITPEPSSAAMLAAATGLLLRRRRLGVES